MIRRTPRAILAAHRMDPERFELYVEGQTDRAFIHWLTEPTRSRDVRVMTVGVVDCPTVPGGERGRLLSFAAQVEGTDAQIRFFADADLDWILSRDVPGNVRRTDGCDLEWYFMRGDCFEKVVRLGLSNASTDTAALLGRVLSVCRQLGALRLLSAKKGYRLPFQRTSLRKAVAAGKSSLRLDQAKYLRALLQNADISLTKLDPVLEEWSDEILGIASTPDAHLVHGKDALQLLGQALRPWGCDPREAGPVLRASFERRCHAEYPALVALLNDIPPAA